MASRKSNMILNAPIVSWCPPLYLLSATEFNKFWYQVALYFISNFYVLYKQNVKCYSVSLCGQNVSECNSSLKRKGPDRFIYTITESAKTYIKEVLTKALHERFEAEFQMDAGLFFFEAFKSEEICSPLKDHGLHLSDHVKMNAAFYRAAFALPGGRNPSRLIATMLEDVRP